MKYENLAKCQALCERIAALKGKLQRMESRDCFVVTVANDYVGGVPIIKEWNNTAHDDINESGLFDDLITTFLNAATTRMKERIEFLEGELSKL